MLDPKKMAKHITLPPDFFKNFFKLKTELAANYLYLLLRTAFPAMHPQGVGGGRVTISKWQV